MIAIDDVIGGNRRALARLLTLVENEDASAPRLLAELFAHTGKAWVIGITGAPGTGKSSLVNAIAQAYRAQGHTVGIIAVDPTSPFTGGAILGDRIRMASHSGDRGVFIRSMATRGSLGGLARCARDAVRVLDAAGYDIVLVETVGAGQSEVDIVRTAHTTVVVEAPGLGDDVQAIKAGILEIADVLVVNKADRPGAINTVRALRAMLELGHPTARTRITNHHGRMIASEPEPEATAAPESFWLPPVVQTVATREISEPESGIPELLARIAEHRAYLTHADHRQELERKRLEIELTERLRHELMARLMSSVPQATFEAVIRQVMAREIDPGSAVQLILEQTHVV